MVRVSWMRGWIAVAVSGSMVLSSVPMVSAGQHPEWMPITTSVGTTVSPQFSSVVGTVQVQDGLTVRVTDQHGWLWQEPTTLTAYRLNGNAYEEKAVFTQQTTTGVLYQSVGEGTYRIVAKTSVKERTITAEVVGVVLSKEKKTAEITLPLTIAYEREWTGTLVGPQGEKITGSITVTPKAPSSGSAQSSASGPATPRKGTIHEGQYAIGFQTPGTYRVTWETEVTIPPVAQSGGSSTIPLESAPSTASVLTKLVALGQQLKQRPDEAGIKTVLSEWTQLKSALQSTQELSMLQAVMQMIVEQMLVYAQVLVAYPEMAPQFKPVILEATERFVESSKRFVALYDGGQVASEEQRNKAAVAHTTLIQAFQPLGVALAGEGVVVVEQAKRIVKMFGATLPLVAQKADVIALMKAHIDAVGGWLQTLSTGVAGNNRTTTVSLAHTQLQRQLVHEVHHAVRVAALVAVQPTSNAKTGKTEVPITKEVFEQSKKQAKQAVQTWTEALREQRIEAYRKIHTTVVVGMATGKMRFSEVTLKFVPLGTESMQGIDTFEVITPFVTMGITDRTFGGVLQNDYVELQVQPVAHEKLTEAQKSKVPPTAMPLDIRYSVNGVPQVLLQDTIRLGIPYQPQAGEAVDALTAFFLSDNGILYTRVGQYNAHTQQVEMLTNRFSLYFVAPAVKSFADLNEDYAWALRWIGVAAGKGMINGRTNTLFHPAGSVSRATFASLLVRAFSFQTTNQTPLPFKDINRKMWHAQDVAVAVYEQLMEGKTERTFEPDASMTRQEVAMALSNVLKKYGFVLAKPLPKGTFRDEQMIDPRAAEAIATMVREGVYQGNEFNLIRPDAPITRTEVAVLFVKVLRVITEE